MNYLYWLIGGVWVPAVLLWLFVKKPVGSKLAVAGKLGVLTLVTQLPVEYLTIRYPMVMGEGHYLGLRILTFPVEDFLFFLTFPMLVLALVYITGTYLSPKC